MQVWCPRGHKGVKVMFVSLCTKTSLRGCSSLEMGVSVPFFWALEEQKPLGRGSEGPWKISGCDAWVSRVRGWPPLKVPSGEIPSLGKKMSF